MARDYPRLGYISKRRHWQENPKNAPNCDVIGCTAKATHRVDIQVNWFRGEDEVASACEAHKSSMTDLLAGLDKQEADREARRRAQNTPTKGDPT
jgi:hypothetical protein